MLSPAGSWDSRHDGWHGWEHWREAERWALDRDLISTDPASSRARTYRIEFWVIDMPFARCHRYAPGPDGRMFLDDVTRAVALAPPEDIPLAVLPPGYLLAGLAIPGGPRLAR